MTDEIRKQELDSMKRCEEIKIHFLEPSFIEEIINKQNHDRETGRSHTLSGTTFQELFKQKEPLTDFIAELLAGRTLVNPGAGFDKLLSRTFMLNYAVSKYIGVDIVNYAQHKTDSNNAVIGEKDIDFVEEDMLRYISKLPNDYSNITINGIDGTIITSGEYCYLMALHLFRVVPSGGIVFGCGSNVIFEELEGVGFFHLLSKEEVGREFDVFYKK